MTIVETTVRTVQYLPNGDKDACFVEATIVPYRATVTMKVANTTQVADHHVALLFHRADQAAYMAELLAKVARVMRDHEQASATRALTREGD